ncbi:MAG: PaaI family thioesterase [Lachnospiraceae bacterium]
MEQLITTVEQAREIFQNDIYATKTTGIVIVDAKKHYAKCTLQIEEKHLNANKTVMGGALFTLADFTFAVASNFDHPSTVSITSQITYLSSAKEGLLTAIAECEKDGRRLSTYTITITDERNRKIAFVTVTGMCE